ncbi:MAG: hypothetical protein JSR99_09990 [Proteobacteria bacterium]|nr:hypothetical protein [Pseudomonadota bacterium]
MTQPADTRVAALEAALIISETDRAILDAGMTRHATLLRKALGGVATIVDYAGQPQVRYKLEGSAVTANEFLTHLRDENPRLGEAPAAERKALPVNTAGVRNPYLKRTWNLTAQFVIEKGDPQLAAALRTQAEMEE